MDATALFASLVAFLQALSLPTLAIIAAALVFDFINGFHDAANATATVIATRTLKPVQAVCWSALFNFVALFVVSGGVAATVGAGLINLSLVTPLVIFAGLIGAIGWNLFTWWRGLPSSSSHALLGAYAGAACAHALMVGESLSKLYKGSAWLKVLVFIIIGPVIGYALAQVFYWMIKKLPSRVTDKHYRGVQLVSSALLSFSHGANDAQKTAGIIAGALALGAATAMPNVPLNVPFWVLVISYTTIALGTLAGGWRIVKTLGFKLAKLTPQSGACAETGAALSIALATALHLPVSSTLATTGAVSGIGAAQGTDMAAKHALRRRIMLAWALTLPAAFAAGAGLYLLLSVAM